VGRVKNTCLYFLPAKGEKELRGGLKKIWETEPFNRVTKKGRGLSLPGGASPGKGRQSPGFSRGGESGENGGKSGSSFTRKEKITSAGGGLT